MTDKPYIFQSPAERAQNAARALWEPQPQQPQPEQQPEVFSRANAGEKLNIRDNGEGSPETPHAEFRETLTNWGGPIPSRSSYEHEDIPLEHIQQAIAPSRERDR